MTKKKEVKKPIQRKRVGQKQVTVDESAWDILISLKELAIEDGISYPSLSDGIRSMGRRLHGK
jgi:hypothetical protein